MEGGGVVHVLIHTHIHAAAIQLKQGVLLGLSQVVGNHFFEHHLRGYFGHSADLVRGLSLDWVTEEGFNFGGTEVSGIDADDENFGRHCILAFAGMTQKVGGITV